MTNKVDRNSLKWKKTYNRLLPDKGAFKSDEAFNKHIDRLVKDGSVKQKNILGSWNGFTENNFDKEYYETLKERGWNEKQYYEYYSAIRNLGKADKRLKEIIQDLKNPETDDFDKEKLREEGREVKQILLKSKQIITKYDNIKK